MISKKEALEIAIEVLKNSEVEYSSIDGEKDVRFVSKEEMNYPIPYGKYQGMKMDYYSISFGEIWGLEERSLFFKIKADNGEPMYIITPHGYRDIIN